MSHVGFKKPGLIRFSEARLVCLQGSSYIELFKPQQNAPLKPGTAVLNCCYCPKSTSHEHDIIGKVKFDPRSQSFLVSLVPNVTTTSKPSKIEDPKGPPKLQIFPVEKVSKQTEKSQVGPIQTFPNSKTVKLFPAVFVTEGQTAAYFATELSAYLDIEPDGQQQNQGSFMRAAKESGKNLIHVIKSVKKKSRSDQNDVTVPRSVLKSTYSCKDCPVCRSSFETLVDMKRHFETSHGCQITLKTISGEPEGARIMPPEPPPVTTRPPATLSSSRLRCPLCELSFDTDELLISHDNEVHAAKGELKFQCEICLQYFKSSQSFKKHKSDHLKKPNKVRNHGCHLCPKRFLKVQHLNDHIGRHFGAKPHQCHLCDKKYTSLFSLKSHKVNSHGIGEKPVCNICEKTFFNRTLLNRHVLEKHKKDSRLTCKHCGHHYLRKDNLEAHVRSAHPTDTSSEAGSDVIKCQLCGKTYGTRSNLTDHMRICHGILPWNNLPKNGEEVDLDRLELELAGSVQCKFCEQTFLPTEMESHLRFSHGVMPVRPGGPTERSITEAAEALLRTLTPQPDYLLRCLTPLPMETLDEIIMESALNKD